MTGALVAMLTLPLLAAIACLVPSPAVARGATVIGGVGAFVLSLVLVPTVGAGHAVAVGSWIRVDPLSEVFVLATAFLYAGAAVYSIGYLRRGGDAAEFSRSARRYSAGLNVFGLSLLWVPVVNDLALLWVAVEITTIASALLVAIEDTDDAVEAAWKYVLIASAGLGIALLGTVLMYAAGTPVLGSAYEPHIDRLVAASAAFSPGVVRLGFALAAVGFGTKMGLVPVHWWLPDAHAEAPTPVSAMLSGSLLAVSFYAILRFFQISVPAVGTRFPRLMLLVLGVLSLILAALYLLDQRHVKRMLAYSSVEHMGILALGMSFGSPIALVGVLLHVLAHAAAKGTAFFGAGTLVRAFRTREIGAMRGAARSLPWSGPLFLLAVLALSAFPPFGVFRSEFQIVWGGLAAGGNAAAAILVVLATLAFMGLALHTMRITLAAPDPGRAAPAGEPSPWMVAPMVAGILVLLVLGLHPSAPLQHLLARAAALLGGRP